MSVPIETSKNSITYIIKHYKTAVLRSLVLHFKKHSKHTNIAYAMQINYIYVSNFFDDPNNRQEI